MKLIKSQNTISSLIHICMFGILIAYLKSFKIDTLEDVVDVLREEGASRDSKIKQVFTPLMMDMEYARKDPKDKPKISLIKQLKMTRDLVLKYPGRFLPFIAADPRRIRHYKEKEDPKDPHGIRYITSEKLNSC